MLLNGELQGLAGLCGHMKYSRKADLKRLGMERAGGGEGGGEQWGSGAGRRESGV